MLICRYFIFICILLIDFSVFSQSKKHKTDRPNIIILLSDDQGWGDLSINGNRNLQTPNIDNIGKKGAQFTNFYVQPVCSPTRAELLTGRYHPRSGVVGTSKGGERFNIDETTLADEFKKAGYATAAFGKWHSGMQYPYHPNGRGFDTFYGFCSGHWGDYFDAPLERNGEIVKGKGFTADDFTTEALSFMDKHKKDPFLLYVPFNTPHSPMQVPEAYWKKFNNKPLILRAEQPEKENLDFTRAALAMCENIDWNVGRIMQKVREMGIEDNTVILYFCDNGPNAIRWNGKMKGIKASTDEGGVRSPLLIQFPKKIKAGTKIKTIAGAIDLLPTLLDLAKIKSQISKPLDGISLKPQLLSENTKLIDRQIFAYWAGKVSLRTQQYRLDSEGKLFDMVKDPSQKTDISQQNIEITTNLKQAVIDWKKAVLPVDLADKRPFTVGHKDYKITQLPARDAQTIGCIVRSSQHPNCSFFTNWKTLDDAILWEVEVLETGNFEVEMYYTCRTQDVGAVIQLSYNQQQIETAITEAYDPPLKGMENDRIPRIESYVKEFKIVKMGQIILNKGQGKLTLKATQIKGEQAVDFRTLVLRRL